MRFEEASWLDAPHASATVLSQLSTFTQGVLRNKRNMQLLLNYWNRETSASEALVHSVSASIRSRCRQLPSDPRVASRDIP